MNKNVKFTVKLLSIPVLLLLLSSGINVISHKFRVISLRNDMRDCIKEYSLLIKDQKMECSESLCEISYSFPEKVDMKRNECIGIENRYEKAFNNMPIKF